MAVANTLISANQFNLIRNKVDTVLGTGGGANIASASLGYGQPIASVAIPQGKLVTEVDYDLLRFDILNTRIHQVGTAGVSLVDINQHDLIAASPIGTYDTLVTTSRTDAERFKVGAGQFVTDAGVTTFREWSNDTNPKTWKVEINTILRATFANANQARWFFNSGGELRVDSTRANPTNRSANTAQSTSWSTLLNPPNGVGTQAFGGIYPAIASGGVTRTAQTGFNFYNLTNSFVQFYRRNNTSPYTSNSYILEARCDVANNSAGTARWVEVKVRFVDSYVDPPGINPENFPPEDNVDGIFTVAMSEKRADSTVFQPIMATTTNQSNSAAPNTLRVPTSGVPYIRPGMKVFGTNIGQNRFVSSSSVSGTNTIITLNNNTQGIVASGTNITLQNVFSINRPSYSISQDLAGS